MKTLPAVFLAIALTAMGADALGCDLELSLVVHTRDIVFGDPLYVEVTLTNRGREPFEAPGSPFVSLRRNIWSGGILFNVWTYGSSDGRHESGMLRETWHIQAIDREGPEVLEPGRSARCLCSLTIPPVSQWGQRFWWQAPQARSVWLEAAYQLPGLADSTVLITSEAVSLGLHPRSEAEIAAVALWHQSGTRGAVPLPGPTPVDLGLPLPVGDREELAKRARRAPLSGELGHMIELSLRLRELFELRPQARDEGNRQLLECIAWEPPRPQYSEIPIWRIGEIDPQNTAKEAARKSAPGRQYNAQLKARVLARQLRSIALRYEMFSTVEALDRLIGDLEGNRGQTKPRKEAPGD